MSNYKLSHILISGVMPADTVAKADIDLTTWFALFASPTSGIRIYYGDEIQGAYNQDAKGFLFRIEGYEYDNLMTDVAVANLISGLEKFGVEIDLAIVRDLADGAKKKIK